MHIDCISDLHGYCPQLAGGDLLLIAGDLTAHDRKEEYAAFLTWLRKLDYRCKVVVAGNHDGLVEAGALSLHYPDEHIYYLSDSGMVFEGLSIWGSPYTPTFMNWHFMCERGAQIKKHWDLIPQNTDILITHGPPYGILDTNSDGRSVGCEELRVATKPRLHIFGHIHECGSKKQVVGATTYMNCSFVDVHYRPVNQPMHIEL